MQALHVLVVECQPRVNWYKIFDGCRLRDGTPVEVDQGTWGEMSLTAYPDSPLLVELSPASKPHPGSPQTQPRTFAPDIVLMRSVQRSIYPLDSRNVLYAFQHAGIPCINSLQSLLCCMERPWVFGELRKIQKRLGPDVFPLIQQTYYPSFKSMLIDPGCPCVLKIGPCHSGYGKIKVEDRSTFEDVRSIVALHGDYATAEKFIDWDYDIRIQKIGNTYRAFKREAFTWKGNVGHGVRIEDMEMTPQMWADECAKLFGGLDILALDAVHCRATDKIYILELNDTAIGLVHNHEDEDHGIMRDIVLMRLEQITGRLPVPDGIPGDELEHKREEALSLDAQRAHSAAVQANAQSIRLQEELNTLRAQGSGKCTLS